MTPRGWASVVSAGVLLSLLSCGPAESSRGSQSRGQSTASGAATKRITAAILGDPRTIRNSINAAGGSGSVPGVDALEDLVNPSLAEMDNRGRWVARLAEAVPTTENSLWQIFPDGRMQTTWKLRVAANWHDGRPVTSEDFVFTATVGQDPEVPLFRDSMYQFIESIEAPDAKTVAINWNRPFIDATTMFNTTQTLPMPKHLLEGPFVEDKANFTAIPFWNEEFVGTGPFRIREWVRGSYLTLAANESYALGGPKIAEIQVRFIPDPSTLMANILAGGVDLTLGRTVSIDQAVQVRDKWPEGAIVASPVNWIAMYPQFVNPTPAIVGDVSFRKAVYQAVDRQEMADSLQAGLAQVAHSLLLPEEPEFRDVERSIVRYEYDPRRAIEAIEALGYTRGSDGVFRDATDERLTLELRTVKHDLYEKALYTVGGYLAHIGIPTEQNVVPPPRISDREYRATFQSFEVIENPNEFRSLERLRLSEAPLPENRFTGRNRVRYMNPTFDALLDRYLTTIPMQARAQVAGQIVHHMTDQLVWMGLFHQAEPTMIANRLQNVMARNQGSTQAWNAHEWDVK